MIEMFSCAVVDGPLLDVKSVNLAAMQRGYLVAPEVCTQSVMDFIEGQTINYNSTFYRTWQDVVSKSRYELLMDQLHHYMSTYGSGFTLGNGYVPNEGVDVVPYKEYKLIVAVSVAEMYQKCMSLLVSGIALKQSTAAACADFVADNAGEENLDVDAIKNREAQTIICRKLGIAPRDKFALLRYIIYYTTDSTMVIKNFNLIDRIMRSENQFDFSKLTTEQMEGLASIFLRFKPLLLAFKHHIEYSEWHKKDVMKVTSNARYINKLRRMAKRLHQPMPKSFWSSVFSDMPDIEEVKRRLDELTPFRVVALMQLCSEKLLEAEELEDFQRLFIIRNQSLYVRSYLGMSFNTDYLKRLYNILEAHLVEHLRKKACPVIFPNGYVLALPSTEKSFVGNMPFGTRYCLQENNYIGIYWRNEWGTHDFDLSVVDETGGKYGWNAEYYDEKDDGSHDIVFSGDMTSADPEASEVMYMRRGVIGGAIYVNRYSGDEGSRYKLFFGQQDIPVLTQNFMVDPNTIKLQVDMQSDSHEEQLVGLIDSNTVFLMGFSSGRSIVSGNNSGLYECMKRKAYTFVQLEPVLRKAGFTDATPEDVAAGKVLDLTALDRATIISLMS